MPRPRKSPASAGGRVDATVHKKAKRTNIPTAELGGFVEEAEARAKPVLYPRDPSLDPQLVWKGKDELDSDDLEVPSVPIYIQEKVAPRALIENLRAEQRRSDPQPNLFADFNGIDFETLVDFYHHQQNWSNRLILGDSLLVMTSLAEKEGLKGQVQCVYIDPPYGIKFGSNWQVSTRKRDVKDGRAEDATRQPEQIRAFRDTWELGIHSYLTYLRDRLVVARDLLVDSGSIFVQIGDENLHLVRSLLDEVFGSANFVTAITFRKVAAVSSPMARVNVLAGTADYVVWYAKDIGRIKYRQLYLAKAAGGEGSGEYVFVDVNGTRRPLTREERENPAGTLPVGARVYRQDNLTSTGYSEQLSQPFTFDGETYRLSGNIHWKTTPSGLHRLAWAKRLERRGVSLSYVRYLDDFPVYPLVNVWMDTSWGFGEQKSYVVQTAAKVISRCLLMTTDPGDLVLDPTCGSGTTAYVAEQWGRRWITIDTSRVALALARTRLMAAKYPYYTLADSAEGVRLFSELAGQAAPDPMPQTNGDVRKGFVYKRVPHVTLKSIANNPDIREGMSQEEIERTVLAQAEAEMLYDQPYEDRRIVRVTGPMTVESLSPHRVLESDGEAPAAEQQEDSTDNRFEQVVLENLKAAGVQNTVKGERLVFESLEPWPGAYIQAVGDYAENGSRKRAAVCIGPEHGTVGAELVRQAAKEAAHYFDILIVCGFAFDARVGEEAKQLGRLTVLKTAMNPDLALGGDLLKKTGSANLFTVFGEPDIDVRGADDGQLIAEIKGLDIYDPTTGEIRSHSTSDIACWFIDTNYNEESFFVRHAYFLGAGDPYAQLKRALRAEINEDVWASLYSTVSRSFPKPETGKIAIKVINHYGDEVMKVYSV